LQSFKKEAAMSQDDRIEQLVDDLEEKFNEHMEAAIEDFFKQPIIKTLAKELKTAGLSKPLELWPEPISAQIIQENNIPVWAWAADVSEDETEFAGLHGDENEEEEPEFGDDPGDFRFLKAMHIDPKRIFTHLNRELDEARQQRQDEEEAIAREEAVAWEDEPDLSDMEDGGAIKKEDARTIPEIIESAVTNAAKLNFFQRVFLFYLLRHQDDDYKELRKAGVKFSDVDMARSLDIQYFQRWVKRSCEAIASNETNRLQLLFFEGIIIGMHDVKPPNTK
jgi:hypothetical protein